MLNRLLPVLFVPAIACGGGDTPTPVPVDTPVTPPADSPAAAPCPMETFGMLNLGSAAMPIESDWFFTPTQGPNTGMKTFEAGGRLNNNPEPDVLIVQYVLPAITGTPAPFQTDAMSTSSFKAASFIFGALNSQAQTIEHFMFAGSGQITITQLGESDGDLIKASVTATSYREVDDAGADVTGGCTSMMGGLALELKQKAAAFQAQTGEIPGLVPLTPDELAAAKKILAARQAQ